MVSSWLRGIRPGTLGRYRPLRSLPCGSMGLWCACARPARRDRSSGNGLMIGPLPASRFANPADGLVNVTYSGVTTLTVAAIKTGVS